jgi:hypothetical protein
VNLHDIVTRRGRRSQDERILGILKEKGSRDVIREHMAEEKGAGLAEVLKQKNINMPYSVRARFRWLYNRYKKLEADMRAGAEVLERLSLRFAPG